MMGSTRHLAIWIPRVLAMLFVVFLSLFALDVFTEPLSARQRIIALAIHLIPGAVMLLVLAIAWRWPAVGGSIFLAAGLFYTFTMGRNHPSWIATIAGPVFVIAALFFWSAIAIRRTSPAP